MYHRLSLLRSALLRDAQQEAHKHSLHQVDLALHQRAGIVKLWPPPPLRRPLLMLKKQASDTKS